ncbi:hypothetical protein, variant [Verruconis gallopava]|uniref:Haloacid dehalogenase-like hydrolase n=1 Tax=Verruconis gallopava TaxID=253628 RepID=A0A0D2A9F5_9PEZI|nr:hypothetical protein, variant [Verruconis gallopava]KIW03383.1 hypothetical protein, variant [Verruconis gallopava]
MSHLVLSVLRHWVRQVRMAHVQLFLDWDGTLTKNDTILSLSGIGYKVNERLGIKLRPWHEIVDTYLAELKAHASSYEPSAEQRKTTESELKYLTSLKSVERASTDRVIRSGVFCNVTAEDLDFGAKEAIENGIIEMRSGWEKLCSLISLFSNEGQNTLEVSIVTVNWSASFIRSCLLHAAEKQRLDVTTIKHLHIYGNEVVGAPDDGFSTMPRNLSAANAIHTTADKCDAMKDPLAAGHSKALGVGQEYFSVYVGDTLPDFCPLLQVDFGICIRDNPMGSGQNELAQTLERVGVMAMPLSRANRSRLLEKSPSKIVYWSNDLAEVASFVENKLFRS